MKNHAVKKITLVSFLLVTLAACSPRASFIPEQEELPDATKNSPYFQKIKIFGGAVIKIDEAVSGKIEPEDSGLFLVNCRLPERVIVPETTMLADGNCVEIKGTPTRPGIVKVKLGGRFYGNMFISGSDFEKTYQINVVAGKE